MGRNFTPAKPALTLESFPVLAVEHTGRKLFFETPPEFYTSLVARGYEVVLLAGMPRNDLGTEQDYLKAGGSFLIPLPEPRIIGGN